ncbi:MAG TPA: hypothetical protein VI111_08340, partial [Thermoleophilaceae bacterium]
MSQRSSRKRRRRGGKSGGPRGASTKATGASVLKQEPDPATEAARQPDAFERRYARSRAKDDAARAALKPLAPGERPTAVTAGAIVAALLAVANLVALAFGYNSDKWNLAA